MSMQWESVLSHFGANSSSEFCFERSPSEFGRFSHTCPKLGELANLSLSPMSHLYKNTQPRALAQSLRYFTTNKVLFVGEKYRAIQKKLFQGQTSPKLALVFLCNFWLAKDSEKSTKWPDIIKSARLWTRGEIIKRHV